jgi:ubiquinone/menaquinone biosynthesis C-methylase UbiE
MQADVDSHRFKIKDAESYDAVTEEFNRFSNWVSAPLADRMIELARLRPGQRVLDVGTGTGIIALRAIPHLTPNGSVVGIDLSRGMLALARTNAQEMGCAKSVEFHRMDGEALEFGDQSFEVVLSLFALLHFPNPSAALAEMFRVLRPGGRLVIAVGSRPPRASLQGLLHAFKYVHQLGLCRRDKLLVAPDFLNSLADKYFPEPHESEESGLAHSGPTRTRNALALVRGAKFTGTKTYWQGHSVRLDSPEEFWSIQRTFSSIARKRLANAPQSKLEKLHDEFLSLCRRVQSKGGALIYPFGAFYVVARRPLT